MYLCPYDGDYFRRSQDSNYAFQFGGAPDCEQCGCIASTGLAAVGHDLLLGPLTAGKIFMASGRFWEVWKKLQRATAPEEVPEKGLSQFKILTAHPVGLAQHELKEDPARE